jgi:DNA-binding GntR family transcriptional regulator
MVTSTTCLKDGRPLEHAQLAWLGDRVRFHITAYPGATPS